MCVVSMVMDYYWKKPDDYWTDNTKIIFDDLVKKAEYIDVATNQPDCVDPEKEKLLERIERLLTKLEKSVDKLV